MTSKEALENIKDRDIKIVEGVVVKWINLKLEIKFTD